MRARVLLGEFPGDGAAAAIRRGASPPPTTLDEYLEFAVAAGLCRRVAVELQRHRRLRTAAARAAARFARAHPELVNPRCRADDCDRPTPSLGDGLAGSQDANRTLGGGMASMELMRRTFAQRGWIDDSEHALLVAVSRFTPGTNVLAYCAGARLVAGARDRRRAVALAAASVPGSLI